jgi:TPR repeat protein
MLAKRLEQPAEDGKRRSRLPYTDVAQEFANRSDYFKSFAHGGPGGMEDVPEGREDASPTGQHPSNVISTPGENRPTSYYPTMGNMRAESAMSRRSGMTPFFDAEEVLEEKEEEQSDYFTMGAPRATSPEPVDPNTVNVQVATPTNMPSLTNSVDSLQSAQTRTPTNGSSKSARSLAPPRSPAFPKSPRSMQSIRSVPPDSGDEEGSHNSSQATSSRKFSGSSGMSRPQSPFSPYMPPVPRSPSMSSEVSASGSQKKMNFSRPMSSNSLRQQAVRASFESQSSFETQQSAYRARRHPSATSTSTHPSSGLPSRQPSQDDTTQIPRTDGPVQDENGDERPTTSYTYAKFTLPRGKKIERSSRGMRESWIQKQFTWDDDPPESLDEPKQEEPEMERKLSAAPSVEPPPLEPVQSLERRQSPPEPAHSLDLRPSLDPPPPISQLGSRPTSQAGSERIHRFGRDRSGSSATRSHSAEPTTLQKAAALHKSTPSIRTHGTGSSDRTIRAVPLHQRASSAELTPEEHLEIGIETHSNGELNKSTYHLRIAAREGLPTGMLLYALACRHGWGMRPNQEEGVRWLKKAIDGAGLEVADVEQTLSAAAKDKSVDPAARALESKTRKAQFALAIYELGISYMNGWGCAKDKPLALQCYEVAGSWGDCDALAEAGFCYTQGNGCKKDLKKAAALYRKAAEGGMSMAGNSW